MDGQLLRRSCHVLFRASSSDMQLIAKTLYEVPTGAGTCFTRQRDSCKERR
jgi:hypothetical protein